MFDYFTVRRNRFVTHRSYTRMEESMHDPNASEAQREKYRDDYVSGLVHELIATGAVDEETERRLLNPQRKEPVQ